MQAPLQQSAELSVLLHHLHLAKAAVIALCSPVATLLLQDAMRAAGRSGTEDCPVQMKLVAPPLYVLTTQTLDKNKGIQVLNDAIEVAEQTIKSHKGNFKVKEAPRTVSERDDLLLQSKVCIFVCTLALHSHSMQLSLYICQL